MLIRSRRLTKSLKLSFSSLILYIVRSAHRQGHDRKRRIFLTGSSEAAPVCDEKVFYVSCLAIGVEHRRAGIFAHANRPNFVACETGGGFAETREHLAFQVGEHFKHALVGGLPQGAIVVAEAKMHNRSRNAVSIEAAGIDGHAILMMCRYLGEASHLQVSGLHFSNLPLKGSAIPGYPVGVLREHVTLIIDLHTPASGNLALAGEVVVAGDVNMIGGTILVKRLLPLEFLQIHTYRISQVTVKIVADHAAGIGEPSGV